MPFNLHQNNVIITLKKQIKYSGLNINEDYLNQLVRENPKKSSSKLFKSLKRKEKEIDNLFNKKFILKKEVKEKYDNPFLITKIEELIKKEVKKYSPIIKDYKRKELSNILKEDPLKVLYELPVPIFDKPLPKPENGINLKNEIIRLYTDYKIKRKKLEKANPNDRFAKIEINDNLIKLNKSFYKNIICDEIKKFIIEKEKEKKCLDDYLSKLEDDITKNFGDYLKKDIKLNLLSFENILDSNKLHEKIKQVIKDEYSDKRGDLYLFIYDKLKEDINVMKSNNLEELIKYAQEKGCSINQDKIYSLINHIFLPNEKLLRKNVKKILKNKKPGKSYDSQSLETEKEYLEKSIEKMNKQIKYIESFEQANVILRTKNYNNVFKNAMFYELADAIYNNKISISANPQKLEDYISNLEKEIKEKMIEYQIN